MLLRILDFNNQIFYILKMSNHIIKNDYIFCLKFMKAYMIHFSFGRSKNIVFNVWDHLLGKGL